MDLVRLNSWKAVEPSGDREVEAMALKRTDAPAADVAETVRRAQGGDSAAFVELIRRYERTALAIAYGVLRDGDQSGDVVQESFARAWEHLGELSDANRFGPWLCGIVRNLAMDIRRRQKLMPKTQTDLSPVGDDEAVVLQLADRVGADPIAQMENQERGRLVNQALAELDEQTRTVLTLRYYDELPSRRIGELLGISPAAVDMRLSRARQQLRQKLADVM